jgi:hypothetical protein
MSPVNRIVGTGEEPVEFRPLPGQEDDWAEYNYVARAGVWYWAGTFPVSLAFMAVLALIGMVASG